MRLVLSVLTQDHVIQVSDRCMTFERGDGAVRFEEGHNKAGVFERRIAFGYTGAGEIEDSYGREWMTTTLQGTTNAIASAMLLTVACRLPLQTPQRCRPHSVRTHRQVIDNVAT
jgi:hypothetical protein